MASLAPLPTMGSLFNPNLPLTAADIEMRRKYAAALAKSASDTGPIQHPLQGIARGVQGGLAALLENKDRQDALDAQKRNASAIASYLQGMGGPAVPVVPGAVPAAAAAPVRTGYNDAGTTPSFVAASGTTPSANFTGKTNFVSAMAPHALAASQATGVDPRIILAQSALETGFGKHAPGNNFFGIKGAGQSLGTTEVVNGQPVKVTDSFKAFPSMADSAVGYADFINRNPRYAGLRQAQGLEAQAAALQASGYATDPNYGAKVLAIAKGLPDLTSAPAADLPAPGAQPADFTATDGTDGSGYFIPPAPSSAPVDAAPAPADAAPAPDADPNVAALLSSVPIAQNPVLTSGLDSAAAAAPGAPAPADNSQPMVIGVNPSGYDAAPLPPPRPADVAPAPDAASVVAAADPNAGAPLPPERPADVPVPADAPPAAYASLQGAPPADLPAPGAQPIALASPSDGSGPALLPGAPMVVANPASPSNPLVQLLRGGVDPNSNDAGAGAFARDPANRAPALAQALGAPQPDPRAVQTAALLRGNAPATATEAQPTNILPPAAQAAAATPAGQPAPAQVAQASPAGARPLVAQAPNVAAQTQSLMAVLNNPYSSAAEQKFAAEQLSRITDNTVTHVDLGDSVGVMDKRGQMIGTIPKTKTSVVGENLVDNNGRLIFKAPSKPMNVSEGTTLVDPNTGQPIFTGQPKNEQTTDQKNYAAAVEGGFKGDFNSFLQQKSQRQGQAVTIRDPNGTERTMFYDPVTNSLKTPEEMGAKPVANTSTNPFAPAGKQPTGEEAKMGAYATRMATAHEIINTVEGQGLNPVAQATSRVPVIGNYLTPGDTQRYNQAKRDFITGVLRQESGAAIAQSEFTDADKRYFPQPGDKPETIEQKRQARETAIKGYMAGAGANYQPPAVFKPSQASAQPAPRVDRSALEAEARRRGLIK